MKLSGDYASIVTQNAIAGFGLGASVDVALLSGGLAASGSGALGSAGFDALTFGGESQEWGEFGKNQAVNAAWGAVGGPIASKFAKGVAPLLTSQLGNKAGAFASELTGAVGSASLIDLSQQSYGVLKYHATDGASGQREIDYSRTGVAALTSVATVGSQKSIAKLTVESKGSSNTVTKDQRMNQARMMAEDDFSAPIVRNVIPRKESSNSKKFYRYVGEGEAQVIKNTGRIPNVDAAGNLKEAYLTERLYKTVGRAKTHNQLPSKPSYRIEIDPTNISNRMPFSRVNPTDNPQWGAGSGVESITKDAIKVDPSTLIKLKGG